MIPHALSPAARVFTLRRDGIGVAPSASERETLRQRFAADRHLLLPGFFAPDLLDLFLRRLRYAPFKKRIADRVFPPAVDLKIADADLVGLLQFVMNDSALLSFVRDVAAAGEVTGFVGTVYRLVPGMGHRDSWHSDVDGNRLVGLTINLSEQAFEGGALEMRERSSGRRLWRVANTGPGDGLLFALGEDLQHRILPVAGLRPKTAFAGWFCRDADLKS